MFFCEKGVKRELSCGRKPAAGGNEIGIWIVNQSKDNKDMRHLSHKLHLYLSIPFGLLLVVICATGAMLAIQDDIIKALNLDYYYVEKRGDKPHRVDELVGKVIRTLPDSIKVTGVEISSDPDRTYGVKLSDADRSTVFVDQYTTDILGTQGESKFFATVKRLHRTLLDSRPPAGTLLHGKYIVGFAAIALVIIVITGLSLWMPKGRHPAANRFVPVTKAGVWRLNYSLHSVAGMYASLFLLVMSLTGLTWSFEWYRIAFYNIFGAEAPVQKHPTRIDFDPRDPRLNAEILRGWDNAFRHLDAAGNGYDLVAISPNKAYGYYLSSGNTRAYDYYTFEDNGEIKTAQYYRDAAKDTKLRGWIRSVHTGSFGGIVTRLIWALAALTGALLPIGGYIIWWRRITPRRGARRCNGGCNKAPRSGSR